MRYCTPLLALLLLAVVVGYVVSAEPAPTFTVTETMWIETLCLAKSNSTALFQYDPASRTVSVRIARPPTENAAITAEIRGRKRPWIEASGMRLVTFLNRHLASPVRLSMSKY